MDATIIIALITTIGAITNALIAAKTNKKIQTIDSLKSEFKEEINQVKKENDKTYLTNFLSEVENGMSKSAIQIKRAYEVFEEYTELNGNSYIHDKWEELRKLGKL